MDNSESQNSIENQENQGNTKLEQPRGVRREVAEGFADPRVDKPKEDLDREDSLELHSMSRAERRKARKLKYRKDIEGMTRRQKISHFIYYYKWRLAAVFLVVISVLCISVTVYKNTRPVALAYAVVNSPNPFKLSDSAVDDFKDFYSMKKSDQVITTSNINYDLDTYDEDYNTSDASYTTFPTLCYEDYYDVIISDMTGVEYCAYSSLIHPLDSCLTVDLQSIFNSTLADKIVYADNSGGEKIAYAIDISGTDFAESFGLGYDDVYLCFPGTSDRNVETIRKLLNYIFELGLY